VQIAESVGGKRRIVRHVGSAKDEATLGLLMEQARDLLKDDLQGTLDLGMEIPQRQAQLLREPRQPVLFRDQPAPRVSCGVSRLCRQFVIGTSLTWMPRWTARDF
jgi:hypothetical protein